MLHDSCLQDYDLRDPDSDFLYGHNVGGRDSAGGDNNVAASYWFGVFYVFFYLADTFTNVPYEALGPEMHPDPEACDPATTVVFLRVVPRQRAPPTSVCLALRMHVTGTACAAQEARACARPLPHVRCFAATRAAAGG